MAKQTPYELTQNKDERERREKRTTNYIQTLKYSTKRANKRDHLQFFLDSFKKMKKKIIFEIIRTESRRYIIEHCNLYPSE